MHCIDQTVAELESDGWLVNQTRMWMASHWTVRNEKGWLHGQEEMYRNLIDGSRAANLLGWQWTVGAGTGKPYGFARWQNPQNTLIVFDCAAKRRTPVVAGMQIDEAGVLTGGEWVASETGDELQEAACREG